VGDQVITYIQEEMVNTFKLRKVMIPEDSDLDPEYHHLPRNDIYMSEDF
jgi:hypothetical protein